ncbi:hypothetical protein LEP1GSC005_0626 [Leptospira santarosai str. ST188]|uniref:Uncharacterized protein n=2 Tax=Leptospira santarosai TaxID=28183 RepID=M6V9Z6_9LEPT|nr:hypothetical protein LEP1GSC179_3906 [Leptospira santarosai str. MOR084]EMF91527.1 hypothetical protein LEP1GSC005_0626 [Leptospira santarosai str. ST188]EMO46343.1 hypothetical protein LEP1GSC187_0929 [Leptospira santarosai str. ZUN179]EMO73099.1 hypothetical protein LEP1GSC130_2413 [Leptospira santarosai str. 200403458]
MSFIKRSFFNLGHKPFRVPIFPSSIFGQMDFLGKFSILT